MVKNLLLYFAVGAIILAPLLITQALISPEEFKDELAANLTNSATTITPSTGWKLISGTPPIPDPSPLIYKGKVKLSGWIIYKYAYADKGFSKTAKVPHFHVADQDVSNLPPEIQKKYQDFRLTIRKDEGKEMLPKEIIDQIIATTKTTTILFDELNWTMEGTPSLNFVEIITD